MAIIALVLSLLISVAPVTEFATFEAIDAPSIELAHTTPQVPEIFIRDHQTAPQMRKLRTGEWTTCGGIHSGLFAGACGWWPYAHMSYTYMKGGLMKVLSIGRWLLQSVLCAVSIANIASIALGVGSIAFGNSSAVNTATIVDMSIVGWFVVAAVQGGVIKRLSGGNSQKLSTYKVQYWHDDSLKTVEITSYGKDAGAIFREFLDYYKSKVASRQALIDAGHPEGDIDFGGFDDEDFAIGSAIKQGFIRDFIPGDPHHDPATAEGIIVETAAAGKFVCLDEVGGNYNRFDLKGDYFDRKRSIVDAWLGDSATLDAVTGEVAVVQGMSWEDIAKVWAINPFKEDGTYNEKWASKYTRKELLAHRMYAVELDPTVVEHHVKEMRDGFGIIEGPRSLLSSMFPGVRLPGGVGFRMFDRECGLVKGRYRFKVNNAIDHVVIWSDPRNIKGTIFRKSGEGVLITYWEYNQRLKPATSGLQLLSQMLAEGLTGWAKYYTSYAAHNARSSASRLMRAIMFGSLDSGLSGTESQSDDAKENTAGVMRRDMTIDSMMELQLPIATSSTLVFLLGKLIKHWSKNKREFMSAATEWNIYLPHSASGIVMAKSAREMLGKVDRDLHDNHRIYWCSIYRELIIDDELYEKCDPNNDMGDEDGDMMFLWLVIMKGVLTVLLSRHPVGIGGFQFLKPEEVAVGYKFTSYFNSKGEVVEVPIAEIGNMPTSDRYKFEQIDNCDDASTPTSDSSWEDILEYERTKRRNAVALGRAINNMTWRIGHGLPFTPIETQLIADASQSGGVNAATMKQLSATVEQFAKQRCKGMRQADRAMVAKFRMRKQCKKKGVPIVNSDFTKLIELSVKEHIACHNYLMHTVETKGTAMRNIEPLIKLCAEHGITPNKERGDAMLEVTGRVITNFTYAANPGIIKAMRYLQRLDGHEAAEIILGAIVSLHENGEYDHPIFSCYQDELPADLLQHNVFGYLTAYLQDKMAEDNDDNPEGPNPDGDGPSTETQTETQTETTESQKSENMDEHTQFEVLDAMKMDELKQICRDSGLKGWSKLKKSELIHFIIDNTDDDNNDDNPTPPNGGGDNPKTETETEAEAAVRIFEAMMPQILEEKAEYEAQKKKEDNMSKNKKTTLVKEWAEAGKKVQLKQNNKGIYFFVVDGGMRWIPKNILSEEDSKDIQKVRAVYGEAKGMMAQGVASTLFKSIGLAGLLFAALLGIESEGLMAMMCNVVVWNQEENGLHPWLQWKQWMNKKRVGLLAQYNEAERSSYRLKIELDELNLVIANGDGGINDKEKADLIEEMIWHYEMDVMRYSLDEIESGEAGEPKDRPLIKENNKPSLYKQTCGTFRKKTTRGKNKGKGYWVTHPGCRPDEPCKRACGGNIIKEDALVIRKGERVTLWYTPVKLSQVESYWGNKVVRRDV